ncbi:MAG: FeoC-like transcriptional regulator [Pseudomonadota bacterium]|nr:FeoC-like transcriptional regulator [Pseudomonadota bacterium]
MNLIKVRDFFQKVHMANCIDVASFFGTTPREILCYIEHWEHKGCLIKCTKKNQCLKTCNLCSKISAQYYRWHKQN